MSPQLPIKNYPPVNSTQECPDIVKDGHYKTFGETVEKLEEVILMYNECQIRHELLIEYLNKQDK